LLLDFNDGSLVDHVKSSCVIALPIMIPCQGVGERYTIPMRLRCEGSTICLDRDLDRSNVEKDLGSRRGESQFLDWDGRRTWKTWRIL
jgi:hypothetical protein